MKKVVRNCTTIVPWKRVASLAFALTMSLPGVVLAEGSDANPAPASDGESQIDNAVVVDTETAPSNAAPAPKAVTREAARTPASMEGAVAPPAEASSMQIAEGAQQSTGERIDIDGKGFSMVVTPGWFIQKNLPRLSLLISAPIKEGEYPRNISVLRTKGSIFINEKTAVAFEEKIVKNFPETSSTIDKFAIRNHQVITMEDGREGLLIYSEFLGSGKSMMQAHILLSSQTDHYLVTYTDIAEHFENPVDGGKHFSDAWASMTSILLNSTNPVAGAEAVDTVVWFFGVLSVFVAVGVVRKYLAGRSYRASADSEGDGVNDSFVATSPIKSANLMTAMTFFKGRRKRAEVDLDEDNGVDGDHNEEDDGDYDSDLEDHSVATVKFTKFKPKESNQASFADDDMEFSSDAEELNKKKFKIGA
jgi:hypothetical protein